MRYLSFLLLALSALSPQVCSAPIQNIRVNAFLTEEPQIRALIEAHPELLYLARPDVAYTQENVAAGASWSGRLFGERFVEFDRCLMTLRCRALLCHGNYETFTAEQPVSVRLSREEFSSIATINSSAVTAALILGDMGKSAAVRARFPGLPDDHDDFYEAVLPLIRESDDFPTFANLPAEDQDLLIRASRLGHFGHMTHLENGPEMFTPLRTHGDRKALEFASFVHLCDVAGALGHVNFQSSLVYTSETHRALAVVREACELILDGGTEDDALAHIYATRGGWLGLQEPLLIRLGAMTRLFYPPQGEALAAGWAKTPEHTRITQAFEKAQKTTYLPAVFVNLLGNPLLGDTQVQRIENALPLTLPLIARILEEGENRPLNFNQVAAVAKHDPFSLQTADFTIDSEGVVTLRCFP